MGGVPREKGVPKGGDKAEGIPGDPKGIPGGSRGSPKQGGALKAADPRENGGTQGGGPRGEGAPSWGSPAGGGPQGEQVPKVGQCVQRGDPRGWGPALDKAPQEKGGFPKGWGTPGAWRGVSEKEGFSWEGAQGKTPMQKGLGVLGLGTGVLTPGWRKWPQVVPGEVRAGYWGRFFMASEVRPWHSDTGVPSPEEFKAT